MGKRTQFLKSTIEPTKLMRVSFVPQIKLLGIWCKPLLPIARFGGLFFARTFHACASIVRLENVIVVRRCGRVSVRARVRECGRAKRPKTFKLKTFWLPVATGRLGYYDFSAKTFKLKTLHLVTRLQNTPNLLQNPVTQLFGKYPPKSNTKRFKNSEREREIDIIYIYVTL